MGEIVASDELITEAHSNSCYCGTTPYDAQDMLAYDDDYSALDECPVEPDGTCEHGSPSVVKHHGLI